MSIVSMARHTIDKSHKVWSRSNSRSQQVRTQMPEITVHAQHCTAMLPKGDTGLVEILLSAGALSHLVDEGGLTPSAVAERMGHSRICHVLERGIFEKRRGPSEHHQFPPRSSRLA